MRNTGLVARVKERIAQGKANPLKIVESGGIKTRVLPDCGYRGAELDHRDVPCCGGKRRRQFLYECSRPGGPGKAWSTECSS